MGIFPAGRASDNAPSRDGDFLFAEAQNSVAIDDVDHFFVAAMVVIRKRRFARRHVEETITELACADQRARPSALSAEGRAVRPIDFFGGNFGKLDHVLVFVRHVASSPQSLETLPLYGGFMLSN